MDFEVLILGCDVNAYYMARCFHEEYNRKPYLISKKPMAYTKYSNILNIKYNEKFWIEEEFLKELDSFSAEHKDKKILLISTNETYTNFISRNKNKINSNFIYNVPDINIIETFSMKNKFYNTYKGMGLEFPKTEYFDCKKSIEIPNWDEFPMIIKPCDVIEWNHIDFDGKRKIYKIYSKEEYNKTLNVIIKSDYKGILCLQKYIEGDDSHLFDAVVYSNKNKEVKLISFAQIGLQEHTSSMIGNAACLINGYNTFNSGDIIKSIKEFMENIGYQGLAEVDIKYDKLSKKFIVLEINPRQGRCSYYVTACGYNIVKLLVDDLIYDKEMNYKILNEEVMLSFVPKQVIKQYVVNDQFKKKALSMWSGRCNPLYYKNDKNFKRKLLLLKLKYEYIKKYKNGIWENK